MDFALRPATIGDAQTLAALAEVTFPLACPPGHTPENIADHLHRVLSAENFREYALMPDFDLVVAATGDAVVGFSLVDYRPCQDPDVQANLAGSAPIAELSKLYVHPDFHGRGVAHELRDEALKKMEERNIHTAWLTVNQLNERANAFYEKSGFTVIAEKKYRVGNVVDDDYLRVQVLRESDLT
jgi:ribosomal protein S18 acetylase RimI-like enzyme